MSGLIGVEWRGGNKLGDRLCRISLFENYYKNTGDKLIDLIGMEYTKYNPYVLQISDIHPNTLSRIEKRCLWNYPPRAVPFDSFKTMAHEVCARWDLPVCYLNRSRLYKYEDSIKFPRSLVINTTGRGHGAIPLHVIKHIREAYKNYTIIQIGGLTDIDAGADLDRRGCDFWESAKYMSECEIAIIPDSFCYWLSKCYRMHRKVILTNLSAENCEKFLPRGYHIDNWEQDWWLELDAEFYNIYEQDFGITKSYLSI